MLKIPGWINIHKLLVKNKKTIFNLFLISYVLGFTLILVGFYLFNNSLSLYVLASEFSDLAGIFSLLLFLATLVPGIFSRFKVFPLLSSSLVLFRRQIGILMFISAMIHSFYLSTIPAIMNSQLGLEFLTTREVWGSISLIILLPVWVTSNNFSQKVFGKFWSVIQRLTYFSLIAIFMHVALTSLKLGIVTFGVLILEISSWIKIWFFDSRSKKRS